MHIGNGQLTEIALGPGGVGGRITCPPELIPAPGQYLLARDGSVSPLPVPVFMAGASPGGFLAAPALPADWTPGMKLHLRGPLGRGFKMPVSSRRVALAAFDDTFAHLLPLIPLALNQDAAVTLLTDSPPEDLPAEVEVQPMRSWPDVCTWADYLALDLVRESLPAFLDRQGSLTQAGAGIEVQILIHAPMPCGGMAECGACAVTIRRGSQKRSSWKMACKDGPVFDLRELIPTG